MEKYTTAGRLVSKTNRNGRVTQLSYSDEQSLLETVTSPFGRTLSFIYDGDRLLQSVTGPDGTVSYQYDANQNLSVITYPDTTQRQYHYEDVDFIHHLTGITDENGNRYSTYAYDTQGRAVLSELAGGVADTSVAYNGDVRHGARQTN